MKIVWKKRGADTCSKVAQLKENQKGEMEDMGAKEELVDAMEGKEDEGVKIEERDSMNLQVIFY